MTDHGSTLLVFARGYKADEPSTDAFEAALADGLVQLRVITWRGRDGERVCRTWHITPAGVRALETHLAAMPRRARAAIDKRAHTHSQPQAVQ